MQVWVVGKYKGECPEVDGRAWEMQGVFSSEERALSFIKTLAEPEYYCIGPLTLDVPLPEENCDWPGCYYPFAPKGED